MSILPASGIGDESTGFYNKVATQSLRTTRGDTSYFYYTPSAGDRMSGTFNYWVKGEDFTNTSLARYIFNAYGAQNEANFSFLHHSSTANMAFGGYGVNYFYTSAFLRDETNWYNMMWTWDTPNGTQNNRQRAYLNGVELTSMGSGTRSGVRQELGFGGNFQHNFLANYYPPAGTGADSWIGGYHAYTTYVNGLALDPTAFGEFKNGVWIPKNYETKPSQISQGTGTAIGDLTSQSGLAGAFDGTRFHSYADSAATSGNQATGYIGKNWGSSKTITGFILYSPTQFGFVGSTASTFTVKLYGKNSAPSNSTDGTVLFTSSSVNDNLISTNGERGSIKYFADTTITSEETISSFTTDTAYSYHWVTITPNSSASVHVGQLEFYEDGNTYYGTGGFRLDFNSSDLNVSGSSRTDPYGSGTDQPNNTIADASGSGNHLTKTTNINVNDFTSNSPENNFANFSDLNSNTNASITEGGLRTTMGGSGNYDVVRSDFGLSSGKWYWEIYVEERGYISSVGVDAGYKGNNVNAEHWVTFGYGGWFITYNSSVAQYQVNQNSSGGTNWSGATLPANGDIVMIAIDVDNNKIWWGLNGTWYNSSGTANPATGTDARVTLTSDKTWHPMATLGTGGAGYPNAKIRFNFGQESTFQGGKSAGTNTDGNGNGLFQYAPPSGYLACCSANLPDLTIGPDSSTNTDDHFDTFLYTGTNATNRNLAVNNFTPDWVWLKARSQTDNHVVIDVLRKNGSNFPNLHPNNTDAEANDTHPKRITNGIQVSGGLYDNSGVNFVVWNWKAGGDPDDVTGNFIKDGVAFTPTQGNIDANSISVNTTAGFSIVEFTSTVTSSSSESDPPHTVAHGLGVKPRWVIIKDRDGGAYPRWNVWHPGYQPDQTYLNYQLWLHLTNASNNQGWTRADTGMTTNLFCLPTYQYTENGKDYIAYVFNEVEGFSKFGHYIGNNSTNGTYTFLGFRPKFLIIKRASDTGAWQLLDSKRNTFNSTDTYLYTPGNGAEVDGSGLSTPINVDFLSNGFKVRTTESVYNSSGATFIYMAFAEQPFKLSNAR